MKIRKYIFLRFKNYKNRKLNMYDHIFLLSAILFGIVDPLTTYIGSQLPYPTLLIG